MRHLKLLVAAVFAIMLMSIVVVFVLQNNTPVVLELFAYQSPEGSLAIYMLGMLIVGALFGLSASWLSQKLHTKK